MTKSKSVPKVLFISGYGRSGSTLVEKILANSKEFFPAGEIVNFWSGKCKCSCGEEQKNCPVWGKIWRKVEKKFGKPEKFYLEARYPLRKFLFELVKQTLFLQKHKNMFSRKYLDALFEVYHELSDGRWIVDSSKMPQALFASCQLAKEGKIKLKILHLVRRPEGILWSVEKVGSPTVKSGMKALVLWNVINFTNFLISKNFDFSVERYENLCADPLSFFKKLFDWCGVRMSDKMKNELSQKFATFPKTHQIEGNRIRFLKGKVEIKCDEGWRDFGVLKKLEAKLLTFPFSEFFSQFSARKNLSE